MTVLLVAYCLDRSHSLDVASSVGRVGAHYGGLSLEPLRHDGLDNDEGVGQHLWRTPDHGCLWPTWSMQRSGRVLASVYPPVGFERVVGSPDVPRAAEVMGDALIDHPARILDLTPPFAGATVDPRAGELHLWTDLLGVGRLFSFRFPGGWVFSNRPAATLLFANAVAAPSGHAWLQLAGCEWAMGDRTAYRGVRAVGPATHVVCRRGRCRESRQDLAGILSDQARIATRRPVELVDRAADSLISTAASVGRLWRARPEVDLSGGRDSRVTAAAFLAADPASLVRTHESVPSGEATVAEHLISLLPVAPEHEVTLTPEQGRSGPTVLKHRIRRWHDLAEVTRPITYLWHDPDRALLGAPRLAVGGAGGEVAHAFYYPTSAVSDGWREESDIGVRIGLMAEHLLWQLAAPRPLTERVHDAVRRACRGVITEAASAGMTDERAITYFYLTERLRRWSTAGERSGTISPFLSPGVVLAALSLTAEARRENALHVDLLRRLQPAWADVPFFKPGTNPPAREINRVGAVADAAEVAATIADAEAWRRQFRPRVIERMWADSRAGIGPAGQERFLARILWRDGFDAHLATLKAVHAVR